MKDTTPDLSGYNNAELVEAYRILKDKIDEVTKSAEARINRLKEGTALFQTELFRRMNESGDDLIRVNGFGTAFKQRKVKANIAEWGEFYGHLANRIKAGEDPADVLSALHKRVSVEYVEAWVDEHDGHLPPGAQIHVEQVLVIRRQS